MCRHHQQAFLSNRALNDMHRHVDMSCFLTFRLSFSIHSSSSFKKNSNCFTNVNIGFKAWNWVVVSRSGCWLYLLLQISFVPVPANLNLGLSLDRCASPCRCSAKLKSTGRHGHGTHSHSTREPARQTRSTSPLTTAADMAVDRLRARSHHDGGEKTF